MRFIASVLLMALMHQGVACAAAAKSLEVLVTRVVDGDTIVTVDSNNFEHRVRLAGIDAPESNQAFSDRSKRNLSALIDRKVIRLTWSKVDGYGRLVAIVVVDVNANCKSARCEPKVVDVNLEQVHAGLAWHYKEFQSEQSPADRRTYASAETTARTARVGLWSEPNPIAPWDWRHGSSGGPVKKSRNGICHGISSSSFKSLKNFTSFDTVQACIASGGRLPKNATR
jgi:endonuclease YncB( thermonuclease family)